MNCYKKAVFKISVLKRISAFAFTTSIVKNELEK